MSKKSFEITFDGFASLTVDEVWPDGDAPENPTTSDVINVMRKSGPQSFVLRDWNIDRDVEVYVDGEMVWT